MPAGVVPGPAACTFELSSTALVGLGEGARYLVEYPYGCAEQQASRALALMLAADLGDAFRWASIDASEYPHARDVAPRELPEVPVPDGGFAYWPGGCSSASPYLTSYLLHVLKVARRLQGDRRRRRRHRARSIISTAQLKSDRRRSRCNGCRSGTRAARRSA